MRNVGSMVSQVSRVFTVKGSCWKSKVCASTSFCTSQAFEEKEVKS